MREIKFRLWYGNEMFNCIHVGQKEVYIDTSHQIKRCESCNSKLNNGLCPYVPLDDCVKESLMQYTGLKDKNGKEIYEGDIIIKNMCRGVIEFFEGQFCVDWTAFNENCGASFTGLNNNKHCEVIGNIHENPELLKGDNHE